ncbi:uncharacterized protein LOC114267917 isoform X5 [Camellia sinensis]|uniref:uncharacterized protein LOC114267917 isoform X5 n=1 Tax=Camellia sinensis TaxID=4442 RepID=UPI0010365789|nr:uncharacterized protein LOC114267917 isoform X5 [Camellia sinensis]
MTTMTMRSRAISLSLSLSLLPPVSWPYSVPMLLSFKDGVSFVLLLVLFYCCWHQWSAVGFPSIIAVQWLLEFFLSLLSFFFSSTITFGNSIYSANGNPWRSRGRANVRHNRAEFLSRSGMVASRGTLWNSPRRSSGWSDSPVKVWFWLLEV